MTTGHLSRFGLMATGCLSWLGLMATGRLSWLGSIAAGRHGGWQEQEAEGSHLKPQTQSRESQLGKAFDLEASKSTLQ